MPSTRQRRVQELLVQEISAILRREMKDPRIGFVTITDARITPDLRIARVFYSVLGDQAAREDTAKALLRATSFIRGEFARRAQLRFAPEIHFEFDTSIERGARLSQLLEQVRRDDELSASADKPGSDGDPASE
jgi:ribosome-binding factor A